MGEDTHLGRVNILAITIGTNILVSVDTDHGGGIGIVVSEDADLGHETSRRDIRYFENIGCLNSKTEQLI